MNAPLTDRDYAEIRAAVMSEIRREPRRSFFVPAFAFASLVVVVLSIFVARQPLTRPPATLSPLRGARVDVAQVGVPQVVAPRPAHRVVKRPHRKTSSKPVQLAAVRMDIQTSDPNIRIIWFAR